MFEERLDYTVDAQRNFKVENVLASTPTLSAGESALQAIQRTLTDPGNLNKAMSLQNLIKQRLQFYLEGKLVPKDYPSPSPDHRFLWPEEGDDYKKLVEAAKAFDSLRYTHENQAKWVEAKNALEKAYDKKLKVSETIP